MGKLQVSNEFNGSDIKRIAFKYLRREYKAKIKKLITSNNTVTVYRVDGVDIPEGNFVVNIQEIVPMVLAITIE
jgi:hypothetical protein